MEAIVRVSDVLERHGDKLFFWCRGCRMTHGVNVGNGTPRWGWNNSVDKPTFTPSVLVKGVHFVTEEEHAALMRGEHVEPRPLVCHSFVTEGRIEYLTDCTHELAGQTIELPNLAEEDEL